MAAAVLAAVGTTLSVAELADIAADNIDQVPFPVASAIILPPCLMPSIESIRSGTVMKAKDPARAIIRGTAITMSLDNGPMREVVLDIETIVGWEHLGIMCLTDYAQSSREGSRSRRSMRGLVECFSANLMTGPSQKYQTNVEVQE